jgi:hypothetical protein
MHCGKRKNVVRMKTGSEKRNSGNRKNRVVSLTSPLPNSNFNLPNRRRNVKPDWSLLPDLPLPLLEQAFRFLANEEQDWPPPELDHLSGLEWMLLEQLLQSLLKERDRSPVH